MGAAAMIWSRPILLLLAAYLGVWAETQLIFLRQLLGAPTHVLPALVVVAALRGGAGSILLVAGCGGLWFDAFSANPLGTTVLPLFAVGMAIRHFEALLLRDLPYAQFLLGAAAGVLVPVLTLGLLLTLGLEPAVGWGTLWQLVVMGATGGVITPPLFHAFAWLENALSHPTLPETSFRPDREIKRGRS